LNGPAAGGYWISLHPNAWKTLTSSVSAFFETG
jgi:hypothetical protein